MTDERDRRLQRRVREAYAEKEGGLEARPFRVMWSEAQRARRPTPIRRTPMRRPILVLAASALAVVWLIAWLGQDGAVELDEFTQTLTTTVMWRSPTDELLELGSGLDGVSTLPTIDFPAPVPEWDLAEERS